MELTSGRHAAEKKAGRKKKIGPANAFISVFEGIGALQRLLGELGSSIACRFFRVGCNIFFTKLL